MEHGMHTPFQSPCVWSHTKHMGKSNLKSGISSRVTRQIGLHKRSKYTRNHSMATISALSKFDPIFNVWHQQSLHLLPLQPDWTLIDHTPGKVVFHARICSGVWWFLLKANVLWNQVMIPFLHFHFPFQECRISEILLLYSLGRMTSRSFCVLIHLVLKAKVNSVWPKPNTPFAPNTKPFVWVWTLTPTKGYENSLLLQCIMVIYS